MVSRNTTLVPSLGLHIGPACEAGLSIGMRRECHRQCHPLFKCLDFLSVTGKVGYPYFLDKIAEMTLKVDQGYWQ